VRILTITSVIYLEFCGEILNNEIIVYSATEYYILLRIHFTNNSASYLFYVNICDIPEEDDNSIVL
jgi:hypothetical protein